MASTQDKVTQLKSMFPSYGDDIIRSVLGQKQNNIEQAIEALLALGNTTLSATEKSKAKADEFQNVVQKVLRLPKDPVAKKLAGNYGLAINTVVWEDSARNKNSSWGPCISDMTLNVRNRMLPIIRLPNYEDLTWDVPMDQIPLVVGNELKKDSKLYPINLKQYLEHFKLYLSKPDGWKGTTTSLYAPQKDSHVIMSAQACFLPVPKGQDAPFNVAITNYQSYARNPAVLAIVSTSQGTSAQVVECDTFSRAQKLYFNKNGQSASFVGTRLSDDRERRGVATTGAMTKEEKQQNMIMVIQVPLKHTPRHIPYKTNAALDDCEEDYAFGGAMFAQAPAMAGAAPLSSMQQCKKRRCESRRRPPQFRERADVEDAIVTVGEAEGEFDEIHNLGIQRDTRYPVRVTLQFYKSTANGVIDDGIMKTISEQLKQARAKGKNTGSLVVGGKTDRPTEFSGSLSVAPWWETFWLSYGSGISLSEDQAKKLVFKNGRFLNSSLPDVKDTILHILRKPIITPTPFMPKPIMYD